MKLKINTIHYFLGLFGILITLFSCEKVIKLDLNKDDPKIIIEAALEVDTLLPNDIQYISIRRTVNFDSEINGTAVDNATISLTDTDTKNTILTSPSTYLGNGKYALKIKPGSLTKNKVYQLDVKVDNKVYSATSACPSNPVPLDSIGVFKQKTFGRYNYSIAPIRNETPKGIPNWYQFIAKKIIKNDTIKINKILVDDDQNLDGVQFTRKPIFDLNEFSPDTVINNIPKFKVEKDGTVADSVEIELTLVNIDYKVYRYLFNLVLNQGGRQSATPSNPDPIFSNGALGYFSVQKSYTRRKLINTK